jgi:methylphosphotriester-DNA--protein-cysteine methyltransferase
LQEAEKPADSPSGDYVASKNSTYFHLVTCPGAKLIKEENKVYFNTKEEALSRGLQPAKNCKELFEP